MDFDQVLTSAAGVVSHSAGDISYQRPDQFKVSYKAPEKIDMISNGEKVWLYDIELNQVVVTTVDKAYGTKGILTVLSASNLDDLFDMTSHHADGSGLDWLVLKPYSPEAVEMNHSEIGFDSDGAIVAVVIEDLLGNNINARFSDASAIEDPDEVFNFEPPNGTEVIQQ